MSNPKWKELLLESLSNSCTQQNTDGLSYCFSTISRSIRSIDGQKIEYQYQPESRTVVHRGFVNERRRPDDPSSNSIELGSSDSLLICTDLRSPKIDQIIHRSSTDHQPGTPSSICWWFAPTGEQYRIQAKAYVVPPSSTSSTFPRISREQEDRLSPVWKHQKLKDSTKRGDLKFDWEEERKRIFDKLSTDLKLSFLGRSKPGSKLINPEDSILPPPQQIQTFEELDQDSKSFALSNFALIVLDPISVDLVRLETVPHQRFSWKRVSDDEWEETELVP